MSTWPNHSNNPLKTYFCTSVSILAADAAAVCQSVKCQQGENVRKDEKVFRAALSKTGLAKSVRRLTAERKVAGSTVTKAVILLPLRPASLTYKNPQRRKIVHGMRPVGHKEQSIDLFV